MRSLGVNMGAYAMIVVALALLCSSGLASCKTIKYQTFGGASSEKSQPWMCTDDSLCDPGFFDLNTVPSLNFSESGRVRIGGKLGKLEKQLQCDSCDGSGTPTSVTCTHSDVSKMNAVSWLCDGDFPNRNYAIDSATIDCDGQEKKSCPQLDCRKRDSCILKFSIRKRLVAEKYFSDTMGPPWWLVVIMVGFAVFFFVMLGYACYAFYLQLRIMRAVSERIVEFDGYTVTTTVSTNPAASSPPAYEESSQNGTTEEKKR